MEFEYTKPDKTWKITFDAKRGGDEDGNLAETCKVKVSLLRVPDTDKLCVSFKRVGGSGILYHEQTKNLKENLRQFNNATQ